MSRTAWGCAVSILSASAASSAPPGSAATSSIALTSHRLHGVLVGFLDVLDVGPDRVECGLDLAQDLLGRLELLGARLIHCCHRAGDRTGSAEFSENVRIAVLIGKAVTDRAELSGLTAHGRA